MFCHFYSECEVYSLSKVTSVVLIGDMTSQIHYNIAGLSLYSLSCWPSMGEADHVLYKPCAAVCPQAHEEHRGAAAGEGGAAAELQESA